MKIDVTSRLGGLGLSILACGAAILIILWGSLAVDSATQRSLRIEQAGRDTANLAIAFREHISRTLTALDQIMLAIKAEHEADPARFELPKWLDHSSFLAGLATHVTLVDADGQVRTTTFGTGGAPVNDASGTALSVAPGATVTFGTSLAFRLGLDENLGAPEIANGSARILATSKALVCTAFVAEGHDLPLIAKSR